MRMVMVVSFALAMLMSSVVVAQYGAPQPDNPKSGMSMKTVSITGKISDDGKIFVNDKDGKSWTITNPDVVKGHQGHHVTLQANVDADTNEIKVLSLKMAKDNMQK